MNPRDSTLMQRIPGVSTNDVIVGRPTHQHADQPQLVGLLPTRRAARFFCSSRFSQLSIRRLATALASSRVPLKLATLGLPPTLSGNEISNTHSSPAGCCTDYVLDALVGHGRANISASGVTSSLIFSLQAWLYPQPLCPAAALSAGRSCRVQLRGRPYARTLP